MFYSVEICFFLEGLWGHNQIVCKDVGTEVKVICMFVCRGLLWSVFYGLKGMVGL